MSPAPPLPTRRGAGAAAGWPSRLARTVAVAAALVAVVGVGVLLLTDRPDPTPSARENTPVTTPAPTPVAASAPADPPTDLPPTTSPSASETTAPALSVTPLAGTGALRLTIALDSAGPDRPVTAKVSVGQPGRGVVRRTATLDSTSTEVNVGNLPGGPATWRVRVQGLTPQQGAATILGPYVAPSPTPAPVVPAPVAPVAPVPVPAPAPAPPQAAPKPQPAPQPKPQPKPQPTSKSTLKSKSTLQE